MPRCRHCKTETEAEHFERVVHNKTPLHGPWAGWRMAGRELVSPDGDRFTTTRLRGLAWRLEAEQRAERARARNARAEKRQRELVKVLVVDLGDWRERHFGTGAA